MILETIEIALPSMPPIYRKIALFILENHRTVGFLSIYSLSDKTGVSTASIMRFTKSLGYNGYAELKRSLQEEIRQHLEKKAKLDISQLEPVPSETQFKVLKENEEYNMRQTLAGVEYATMDMIISWILSASRIYTCGFGFSSYIMELLALSFSCILPKEVISLKGSVAEYSCRLNSCSAGDIVISADFPPYCAEVFHVAEHVRRQGARFVLFTDSPRCPAYSLATTVIRCENNSLALANSYVGLVSILQVLINVLFFREKEPISRQVNDMLAIYHRGCEIAGLEASERQ